MSSLDPNHLPSKSDISESHMIHARQCWCLNDNHICCRSYCPCHVEGELMGAAAGILGEIANEVESAQRKHGPQLKVPMFDLPLARMIATGQDAKVSCQAAFAAHRGSWADILIEEVAEAMDETHDMDALREELIQVGAMAVAMIRALDYQRNK